MKALTLTILGPPRTKKTSNRIVQVRGKPRVLPSKANVSWTMAAVLQLRSALRRAPSDLPVVVLPYFAAPVGCRALVYRDALRGDLIGYLQAIADALEQAGVVTNDKLIESWDGSRMLKDARNPRVEITIEAVES